jgi:hypothetical protein
MLNRATMTIVHVGTVVFPKIKSMPSVCKEEGKYMHGSSRGSGWVADQGRDAPFIHLASIQTRSRMDHGISTINIHTESRMNMLGNGDRETIGYFVLGATLDVNRT